MSSKPTGKVAIATGASKGIVAEVYAASKAVAPAVAYSAFCSSI